MTTSELAEKTGTTKRTIRYYLAEGLLPPPGGSSARMEFDEEHALRLRLIRHFQEAGVKLGAMKSSLGRYTVEEVQKLLEAFDRGEAPPLELLAGGEAPPPLAPGSPGPSSLALVYSAARKKTTPSSDVWRRVRLTSRMELLVSLDQSSEEEAIAAEIIAYANQKLGVLSSSTPPPPKNE